MYLKGDMVIREGEVSREMYFIKSGAIQVPPPQPLPAPCNLQCCGRSLHGACAASRFAGKHILLQDCRGKGVPGRGALPAAVPHDMAITHHMLANEVYIWLHAGGGG